MAREPQKRKHTVLAFGATRLRLFAIDAQGSFLKVETAIGEIQPKQHAEEMVIHWADGTDLKLGRMRLIRERPPQPTDGLRSRWWFAPQKDAKNG